MDNLNRPNATETTTAASANQLWDYVQSMDHAMIDRLSHPTSIEVEQVMERHIASLLGHLPPEGFHVAVTTNREHLGNLLSAAMMNGYFLRAAEQRMAFDNIMQNTEISSDANRVNPSNQDVQTQE